MIKNLARELQEDDVIYLETVIGHLHGGITFDFEIYLGRIVGFQ